MVERPKKKNTPDFVGEEFKAFIEGFNECIDQYEEWESDRDAKILDEVAKLSSEDEIKDIDTSVKKLNKLGKEQG